MNLPVSKELFYDWSGANLWIFKQVNSLSGQNALYDRIMRLISDATDAKHVVLYYVAGLVAISLLSLIVGSIRKRSGNRYIFNHWVAVTLLFCVAFPANVLVNKTLKDHFAYPRPYAAIESSSVNRLEERSSDDANRSFPSGHTAFIVCLVACLWSRLSESARPLGVLAIALVGWSRMALGMHFPADIVGSIIITIIVVSIIRMFVFGALSKVFRLKW